MLALLASMGGFIFGYDTGQISDILEMDDFLTRFAECDPNDPTNPDACHFSNVRAGLIVGLLSIGTLVGALLGAPTADKLGRRYAMTAECMLFIVGVIIQMATFSVWQQFAVGRLISGFAVGALSAAVPMYQAESAPPYVRPDFCLRSVRLTRLKDRSVVRLPRRTSSSSPSVSWLPVSTSPSFRQQSPHSGADCFSIGAREINGPGSWRLVVGLGIIWPFILGVGILFMPESPRYVLSTIHTISC